MAEERKGATDWQELSKLTQGQPLVVERVRLARKDVAIEGSFELPQLARLNAEDQVFVVAFVRSHGSIKEMEQVFGVSYPTIKARLNRIAASLEFVETNPAPGRAEVLERLQRGEISAAEAIPSWRRDNRTADSGIADRICGGWRMIPWGASVRVQWRNDGGRRRGFRIWVPLFLVWLVLLPLVLILFPVVALVGVLVHLNAVRLYGTAWGIVSSLRKTLVEVDTPEVRVWVSVA